LFGMVVRSTTRKGPTSAVVAIPAPLKFIGSMEVVIAKVVMASF
jgi:hypothetical protein